MKIVTISGIASTDREVHDPHGGWISYRAILAKDKMGFSLHKTVIPKGPAQYWHYKNHLEACYCIAGRGVLRKPATGETVAILPDTIYVLDEHDGIEFEALEDTVLISIFNPPVTGRETHDADGSYALLEA